MKKILFALSIILAVGLLNNTAKAQVNINVNVNSQPAWGPSGYDYANFYYFPDLNIYFDISNSSFYYLSGSKWTSSRYLPDKYSKYDFYSMYKVVINDNSQPWLSNKTHKKEYSQYKNNKTQIAIRNSNDTRYNQSKNNTINWVDNSNFDRSKNKNTNNSNKNVNDTNRAKANTSNKDSNKRKTGNQSKVQQSPNRN